MHKKNKEISKVNISSFNKHCCGCGECAQLCPVNAISMERNSKGFLYPSVDDSKCVSCGKCVEHCSFNQPYNKNDFSQKAFAVKHIDELIRSKSRSGGAFTALTDIIFSMGGVVYGCTLNGTCDAIHVRADSPEKRDLLRGSKYIQSNISATYNQIKNDLANGKWVVFSGTACQVNAIKNFCSDVSCEKLLLIDIVCHGVPSTVVWEDYVKYVEKKQGKKVVSADFRDKEHFGWFDHRETFYFEDDSHYSNDIFKELFYAHLILREDCFNCPYKNLNRVGDITLADCWGISQDKPDFDDDKGVSLVLINTEKGQRIFNASDEMQTIEVDISNYLQSPLKENWPMPDDYYEFWKYYYCHSFEKSVKKYVYKVDNILIRGARKIKRIIG